MRQAARALLLALASCDDHGVPAGPGASTVERPALDAHHTPDEEEHRDDGLHDAGAQGESEQTSELVECVRREVLALKATLDVCRTCHVQNGVARDSRFLLDRDASRDAVNLVAAFQEVGQDLLLTPAEERGRAHDGGRRLTQATEAYRLWEAMLATLADPQSCK